MNTCMPVPLHILQSFKNVNQKTICCPTHHPEEKLLVQAGDEMYTNYLELVFSAASHFSVP